MKRSISKLSKAEWSAWRKRSVERLKRCGEIQLEDISPASGSYLELIAHARSRMHILSLPTPHDSFGKTGGESCL